MGAKHISDERVRELRTRRVINGERLGKLAGEFGMSVGQVSRIVRGDYRASAGGPLQEPGQRTPPRVDRSGTNNPNAVLTPEDRQLVRELVRAGGTHQAVADVMFISRSQVTKIVAKED